MIINRDVYLNRLVKRIGNGSIKIITGLRRSGKSFLLNELFYNYLINSITDNEHIIRFSFDSAKDLSLLNEDLIDLKVNRKKASYKSFMKYIEEKAPKDNVVFLLLDEIQNLEAFEYVLNSYLNEGNYEIYVTGSNARFLSKDVVTEFRGRGDEIHVLPLSFKEYYDFVKIDFSKALDQYMIYGGLPRVVLSNTDEEKINYLKNLFDTTYFSDVIERYSIRNRQEIADLINVLSSCTSSLINPSKIHNTFKSEANSVISDVTISKYIDYFEEAFLINKVLRYNVKGRKYISTPYKIYFEDIGLRNARLNFRQIEETHLMENIIYNELRYRGFNIDVGAVPFRSTNNRMDTKEFLEVDFIANKGSIRYYIQSTLSVSDVEKLKQETHSLSRINDSFKKIIIVKDTPLTHYTEDGYLILKLEDFLLNEDSLRI